MKMRFSKLILALGLAVVLSPVPCLHAGDAAKTVDMAAKPDGEFILTAAKLKPDAQGVLAAFDLKLPAIRRGLYFQSYWWPAGANRVYGHVLTPTADGKVNIGEVKEKSGSEGGLFAVFERSEGGYFALLPLAGDQAYAWLAAEGGSFVPKTGSKAGGECNQGDGTLRLKLGHHGIAEVGGKLPVCVWATGATPYEASYKAWKRAAALDQIRGALKLREEKAYPEAFRYLGWCSWDCFHLGVTGQNSVETLKGLTESPVPIRWALIDDGHYDKKTLLNNEKFPNSYAPLMEYRSDSKLKWMGIWYAMFGNFEGTKPNPGWDAVQESFKVSGSRMMPKEDVDSGRAYFRHIFREAKKYDFDLLKIDFQSYNINYFKGKTPEDKSIFPNPYEASVIAQQAFHEVVKQDYKGLINCNWHNPVCLFKSYDSVVGRCSEDNRGGEADAISHTFHAFAAMPWLGQVAWGDHDMFHSGDKSPKAAKFNAVAKAMSGGPVYLSELAEKIRPEFVSPLVYQDGELLRPLAPGAPLAEDLFHELYEERLMTAVAPLAGNSALFVVYGMNRNAPASGMTFKRVLTDADYAQASGMIQPYPGLWPVPKDGILVYDWQAGTARELGKGYEVALKGFDYQVLQMSPIEAGVAIIGRTDKHLPAAAVKLIKRNGAAVEVTLAEAGPFGIWCRTGHPQADGISFEARGNGLFISRTPVASGTVAIKIKIIN